MADADEDAIPRGVPDAVDVDLSDEMQDFRFLTSASLGEAKIPKRGEKDFEPHKTALQSNTLAASRAAMHTALSFQRVHSAKKHNVAIYHPETNLAYTESPKGPLFKTMGKVFSPKDDPLYGVSKNLNRLWLLPEEVLYLMDRGTIDVRWPRSEEDDDGEDEDSDGLGLPMSLQGAYAAFLGFADEHHDSLTFERYSVYSGLKRLGYTVHRARSHDLNGQGTSTQSSLPATWQWIGLNPLGWRAWSWFSGEPAKRLERQSSGPLVYSKTYRSYADIYRELALIPWYDSTKHESHAHSSVDPTFEITYDVWKPSNARYKKSDPGPPDFQIAVVDARQTVVPTLAQLGGLMSTRPFEPLDEKIQLYQKLRHGYKNVILAVVDQGVTSYLRLSEAGFGRQKLYDRTGVLHKGKKGGRPQGGKASKR